MTQQSAKKELAVGDLAPDFTTDSTAGTPVTLSSFRGKKNVLLAFFPLAFTRVCTVELCDFSTDFDQFSSRDIEVLPISVDAVPSLKEFKAKYEMREELLSDFKRRISEDYAVLLPDRLHSARAYFLIDKSGRIVWKHVEASTGDKRTNEEILQQVEQLIGS